MRVLRARQKGRGFTLLELLMVVIIIAILASIALPQYIKTAERSRAAEALAVLGTLRSAQIRYKASSATSIYTTDLNDIDVDLPGYGTPTVVAIKNWEYTSTTSRGEAKRSAFPTRFMYIRLDNGLICTTNNDIYSGNPAVDCPP